MQVKCGEEPQRAPLVVAIINKGKGRCERKGGLTSNLNSPLAALLSGTSSATPPGRPCSPVSSSRKSRLSWHCSSTPACPSSTEKWRGAPLGDRAGLWGTGGGGSGAGRWPLLYHSGISTCGNLNVNLTSKQFPCVLLFH